MGDALDWEPEWFRPPIGDRGLIYPDGAEHFTGLTYALIPGFRSLLLDVHTPMESESAPVVLWIHGGAYMWNDRNIDIAERPPGALFQAVVDHGLAIASLEYRHSLEAPFPAQLHDVKAALRYLRHFARELHVDGDRIGVWGDSAGGHLAALAGLTGDRSEWDGDVGVTGERTDVAAVVDWYGPMDAREPGGVHLAFPEEFLVGSFTDVLRELPLEVLARDSPLGGDALRAMSPIVHVRSDAPPFLVMHGTEDSVVPVSQSDTFVAAMRAAGAEVEYHRVVGAEHTFVGVDPLPLVEDTAAWLATRLRA